MKNMMQNPVVMTLDAGGTNFVFSAIKGGQEVARPVHLPANGHDLELCLRQMISGFEQVEKQLDEKPEAISFAFPGPADYVNGIIGDLGNLPGFRGGVALGPMLKNHFQIPVYINNDGDLFAYGEAMYGLLPEINGQFSAAGSEKRFKNLFGITLGTGFGGGLVSDGKLYLGDNGAGGEVWLLRNAFNSRVFAEESLSARAIINAYEAQGGAIISGMAPVDVYQIAAGDQPGHKIAALTAFKKFGHALGQCLADIITVIDGLVVIGGGLSRSWPLFAPEMFASLNGSIESMKGDLLPRLVMKVWDLENEKVMDDFIQGESKQIQVPFSSEKIAYDPLKRTGIGLSRLGASKAISLGAYGFAINALNESQ